MPTISATRRKLGRELKVGDDLIFLGIPRRITGFRALTDSPLVQDGTIPAGSRVAECHVTAGRPWGMTVCPDQTYEVLPAPEPTGYPCIACCRQHVIRPETICADCQRNLETW